MLSRLIDEKQSNLRLLISKESKIRYENIEELEEALQTDFPALQSQIKEVQSKREEKHTSILESV